MDRATVVTTDETLINAPVTLTTCDREPIHIPGSIQPYGFLLCLEEGSRRVVHASANAAEHIGIDATALLGAGLERLLDPTALAEVERALEVAAEEPKLLTVPLLTGAGRPAYRVVLHRHDGLLWLEFEPVAAGEANVLDLATLNQTLGQMLTAGSVLEFCQFAVDQVRDLTGFDRVLMYRFAEDASGEVVAEAKREDLEPFFGLHYPATDIPQQARAMYLKNWLRFIADVDYQPAPLVPVLHPEHQRPPDMTHAVLRSVSPIHLQYLRNMGVAATMTISIIQENRLWGLITCHHLTPRLLRYELRELCLFIGKTFSALLKTKQQQDEFAYQLHIRETQAQLFEQVGRHANFLEGLYQRKPTVTDVFDCGGAAICFEGNIITLGTTPTKAQIAELTQWLQQHAPQDVFYTNSYVQHNPAGLAIRGTASGILAVSLSQESGDYLIWFRPEVIQTVTWAGREQKAERMENGLLHLSPRQSFEAWKQTVDSTAVAWRPMEIKAAEEIRLHLSDVRLKIFNELQARAASLSKLNSELERSNDELDSFAYVASHDLKEPLRGIHNYSIFLLEDYADKLDAEGTQKLETLVRLSRRMEALIESLLQLSRVGRQELVVAPTDLNAVLEDVLDVLQLSYQRIAQLVTVHGPLPTLRCDAVRLREVFANLLTNALKYNDKPTPHVEVGLAPAGVRGPRGTGQPDDYYVFYVRDNGIGIDARHHETVFKIFKRLHAQDKYGGGTGAGLPIARKMVERHEGELWLESEPGQGTTFFFSLSKHL
ncbi:GAF domain-containing protein [Hymenobacter sp. 15J16-1T3B]|uniref:ATP-binding protein n=1 Tax=Hymenobacter sp. 15J16-1T3B TaxID=2886941 RepID=UPI001D0F90E8|nr:ATP-binding protein [Hymenobacter sp. 15J16-1T3B]MCC3160473.1 GAF domain-containing protein [Hymenobacter sp. 15J16-1T3B]